MTVLSQEIDSIHHANRLFWEQGTAHGRNAKVEYYCRQDRLVEIRSEMAELSDLGEWSWPWFAVFRILRSPATAPFKTWFSNWVLHPSSRLG